MNTTAWDQLEDTKLNGYGMNEYSSDVFWCKQCHNTFEDLDDICEVLYTTIHRNVSKNIAICLECAG